MEHFFAGTVCMCKTYVVDREPIICAKVVQKHVNATTFEGTGANTGLEKCNHAQILLVIRVILNLGDSSEILAFINPFIAVYLSDEAHLLCSREQGIFKCLLERASVFK